MKKQLFHIIVATVFLTSCSTGVSPFDIGPQAPQTSRATYSGTLLKQLPKSRNKTVVSTYKFTDQTGQHKPNGNFSEYSRAVTQGGLSILNQSLYDAGEQGWFTILERENLANLVQERNIISKMRQQYRPKNGKQLSPLPPMLYAGLILEGGIVSYESDILTGGLGARYMGIGGNTEYRQDVVSVYLRAVSVKTGEILLSINTSKTIYSAALSAGMFRFLSVDKLLEIETGITVNEPPQLAVQQAIEMAVYSLIMEGAIRNIWQFADKKVGQELVEDYVQRRDQPYEEYENIFELLTNDKVEKNYLQMDEEGLTKLEKLRRRSQMYKKLRLDLEKQRLEKMKKAISETKSNNKNNK
jgi:curli production assembly/transport component CsgG